MTGERGPAPGPGGDDGEDGSGGSGGDPPQVPDSRVAVVIVTHNSAGDLPACLRSLREHADEVVVSDNDSSDDSVSVAEEMGARVVRSTVNRGFAAGANRGASVTTAPVVVFLNPDGVVHGAALETLAERMVREPDLAAVGPLVRNPDGTLQQSCRRFPSVGEGALHGFLGLFWAENPVSRRYTMADWDHHEAADVDWISGAAMAVRHEAFDALGGFDEGYFMYVEDVDLCWRLREAGWRVAYEPGAEVTHVIGTSSRTMPYRLLVEHHRSMLRFERRRRQGRHGARRVPDALAWAVIFVGVWIRAAAMMALRWFRGPAPDAEPDVQTGDGT